MYGQNHNFADEYYFKIPKPDHTGSTIGEDGRIHVKNLSAFWIPELTVVEVIHGCTYTVTRSYEGCTPTSPFRSTASGISPSAIIMTVPTRTA